MNWQSWTDFIAMGGYGLYIWGAYAVTAGCITLEVLMLVVRRRKALRGQVSRE